MDYRTELLNRVNKFSIESVEEFKEAEMRIVRDSGFRSIRKKKDYGGHIAMLRKVKSKANRLDPKSVKIPEDDIDATYMRKSFEKCLLAFSAVCDGYVQMQIALKEKSEGADISYGQYKELNNKVKAARVKLNDALDEMNIIYANFTDYSYTDNNEDLAGVEYKTYDQL